MISGPRPCRLVLLTLFDGPDVDVVAGGFAVGGAAVELLDRPDVWSRGAASGSGGGASVGSSISTSGMSFADALPEGSVPVGILATLGAVPCPLGPLSAFDRCHHIYVMNVLLASDKFVRSLLSNCILGKSTLVLSLTLELRGACTPLRCGCVSA